MSSIRGTSHVYGGSRHAVTLGDLFGGAGLGRNRHDVDVASPLFGEAIQRELNLTDSIRPGVGVLNDAMGEKPIGGEHESVDIDHAGIYDDQAQIGLTCGRANNDGGYRRLWDGLKTNLLI